MIFLIGQPSLLNSSVDIQFRSSHDGENDIRHRGSPIRQSGTKVAHSADMFMRRHLVPVLAIASTIATLSAASNPKEDFAASWEGQTVVLKHRLHTLAYRERGRLGKTSDKRDGLFVVTPFNGTYYQFDGRQSKEDVQSADPQSLANAIRTTYMSDTLDIRDYQKVEPLLVTIYEPGVELIVSAVQIDRDRVRLTFTDPRVAESQTATSLLVQWPAPFSRGFTERPAVETVIRQYIQPRERS